jgi:GH35 family endo-1,4-beta-xylanase
MKKVLIISALGAMFMASCADEFDQTYTVGRPDMTAEYAYLEAYEPLKEYVDNSDFHLGLAVAAPDYNKQELVYSLANSNFTEIVAGNAMKMASVVNDKGEMNFATVSEFVDNATDAGMSVYGHTLAWHSQQPVKWLNSLLADKPAPIPEGGANACIVYDCGDAGANPWDKQAHYKLPIPMEKGKTYVVKARVKADNGGDFGLWPIWDASPNRDQWGGSADVSYQASYPITSSFSDLEWTFEAPFPIDKLQFVFGKIGGKVYIDDLSCKEKGSDAEMVKNGSFDEDSMDGWGNNWNGPSFSIEGQAAGPATFFVSLINNGDMEGDDATNFAKKENAGATVYEITDGVGKNGSRGVKIASKGGQPDAWESQFWIVSNEVLNAGDKIHVSFDYRADGGCAGTNVDTQAHFGPGEYQHWQCAGTVSFTNEWQTYEKTLTLDTSMAPEGKGMKSIAFNMSPNAADGNYYIDNVVLEIEKSGDGIPLTPEERKDTLTWAMEKWIAGMMEACDGKVKAWDVVNEAISGGNPDGEGVYALQHGTPENTTDFFWQDADKLGDLDYVRTAVRLARQYGPEDIKLFINDYNLESDWDQNNKLKSLIAWIKRWEADGVTKIDGIGSQMHISCYANPTTQASKKAAIENMLKLMASSGKLCRISELDMGYVDADGNSVKTDNMTEEMHHQMAELYTFVIEKYKEIIPVNQQWGICQWCATDAPADSGWRKGEPVGLWDSNYYRKHTYAGFADGLAGK